jgi:hypothetical protein
LRICRACKWDHGARAKGGSECNTARIAFPFLSVDIFATLTKGNASNMSRRFLCYITSLDVQKMRFPDGRRPRRLGPGQVRRFQVKLRCPTGSRTYNKDYDALEPTVLVSNRDGLIDTSFARGRLHFASLGCRPFRGLGT